MTASNAKNIFEVFRNIRKPLESQGKETIYDFENDINAGDIMTDNFIENLYKSSQKSTFWKCLKMLKSSKSQNLRKNRKQFGSNFPTI